LALILAVFLATFSCIFQLYFGHILATVNSFIVNKIARRGLSKHSQEVGSHMWWLKQSTL